MTNTDVAQVFPPGEILREELEAREWSQVDLAEILGRPVKLVNELVVGKRAITPETAHGLSDALGTSAELWMNLESQYQLYRRSSNRSDDAVSRRARLFDIAPVKEMQRRGWIRESEDVGALEKEVCRFFAINSVEMAASLPHAAKKSTGYAEDATPAQRAWVQRVRQLGESVDAGPFSDSSLNQALARLRTLLGSPNDVRNVPAVLAEAGIRMVIVEPLARTRIDGVCVWLDERRPVVSLSMRFDRIDSFWFALLHELGHVKNRDGLEHPIVDLDLVGDKACPSTDKSEAEQAADAFASEFLIAQDELTGFMARVAPLYSKKLIQGFAAQLGIHPGIVTGQLQYRGEIGYWHSREVLERVKGMITSSALTDGWGDQPVIS